MKLRYSKIYSWWTRNYNNFRHLIESGVESLNMQSGGNLTVNLSKNDILTNLSGGNRKYLREEFCNLLTRAIRDKNSVNCYLQKKSPLYVKCEGSRKVKSPFLKAVLVCSRLEKGINFFLNKEGNYIYENLRQNI